MVEEAILPAVGFGNWKYKKFSEDTKMQIRVCQFPPGTSKWNKIQHKLFSFISINWRGSPLTSLQVVINLIGQQNRNPD